MGRKGSQRGWRTWDRNLGLRTWLGRKERKLKTQEVSLKTLHSIILGDWGWPDPPALPAFSARVQTPQPRPELRGPSCLLCGMEAHPLGGVTLTAITICHLYILLSYYFFKCCMPRHWSNEEVLNTTAEDLNRHLQLHMCSLGAVVLLMVSVILYDKCL